MAWLGCEKSLPQRLEGRWRGSKMETLGGEMTAELAGWARGTELVFSGTRLDIRVPGQKLQRGSFTIDKHKDGDLELTILGDDGHSRGAHLTLETDQLLRWHVNELNTVVLRRP